MAYRLVEIGRKEKMPEALIAAARVLGKISIKTVEAKPVVEKEPKEDGAVGAVKTEIKASEAADFFDEAKALLAEAKQMGKKNDHVAALADEAAEKLTKARGAVGGPKQLINGLAPGTSNIWSLVFVGGVPAQVLVRSNNGAQLRLEIYSPANNRMIFFTGPVTSASWLPPAAQLDVIRVTNLSPATTLYQLITN
jgi:hypothetical protein